MTWTRSMAKRKREMAEHIEYRVYLNGMYTVNELVIILLQSRNK